MPIIVVGTGLAGASAAASLGELGYNVLNFCIQDSPRRAHSIAAQGGINAAKNYQNDGDSIYRLFYDTVKGGDYRSREANVYRLAQLSVNIIDQCVAQGVPFAREYGGLLDNRSFGGAQVSRTFYARGQTGQQLLLGAYQSLMRQVHEKKRCGSSPPRMLSTGRARQNDRMLRGVQQLRQRSLLPPSQPPSPSPPLLARSRPARRPARRARSRARPACPPAARSPPARAVRWSPYRRRARRVRGCAPDRRSRSPIWRSCRTPRGSRAPGTPRARACRARSGRRTKSSASNPGARCAAPPRRWWPGPRVTKQMPGRPVALPAASAIMAAPPSWRQTVTAIGRSWNASSAAM